MIHNIEKQTLGLNHYMNSLFTYMISNVQIRENKFLNQMLSDYEKQNNRSASCNSSYI